MTDPNEQLVAGLFHGLRAESKRRKQDQIGVDRLKQAILDRLARERAERGGQG